MFKQINVILWLLILCLMKRYVDVKRCYKKYSYHFIYKKKITKSHVFVILSHLFLSCIHVIYCNTLSWSFEGYWSSETGGKPPRRLTTSSDQRHASPILSTSLISKSMAEVSGVQRRVLDLVAW